MYIYINIIYEWLSREDEQETRGFQVLLWMLVRTPPNGHRRGRISRTWRSVALEFSGIKMAPLRPIFLVVMDSFSLDSDSGQGPTWQLWPCIFDFGESHDFIQFSETQEYNKDQPTQPTCIWIWSAAFLRVDCAYSPAGLRAFARFLQAIHMAMHCAASQKNWGRKSEGLEKLLVKHSWS